MNKQTLALILIRLSLGLIFAIHGGAKFAGGIGGTAAFFESISIPSFLAYIVATIELVGGVLLIFGVLTKIISALFVFIMLGAIFTVKGPLGFLDGYELEFALIAMSVTTFIASDWKTVFAFVPTTKQITEVSS